MIERHKNFRIRELVINCHIYTKLELIYEKKSSNEFTLQVKELMRVRT